MSRDARDPCPDLGLRALLASLPDDLAGARAACAGVEKWRGLLAAARRHGVLGVVLAGLGRAGIVVPDAARAHEERVLLVEEMRHAAMRRALAEVLAALARAEIANVALKGPLLAARLYAAHEARPSTDLDVLIDPSSLDATVRALAPLGYVLEGGARGQFFRETHHHVHLLHPTRPLLEVHLEAYRGFGTSLAAAPLLARSVPCDAPGLPGGRVLSPEDEWLYLAVHGASHRFERLGWLYDLKLLARAHPDLRWDIVAARARALRVSTAVALAATLLSQWLGGQVADHGALGRLGPARVRVAEELARPRASHLANAAASFGFAALACDVNAVAAFGASFLRVKLLHELPLRARTRFSA